MELDTELWQKKKINFQFANHPSWVYTDFLSSLIYQDLNGTLSSEISIDSF